MEMWNARASIEQTCIVLNPSISMWICIRYIPYMLSDEYCQHMKINLKLEEITLQKPL